MSTKRLDDWQVPGLPSHQQIRARRVRLLDCACQGCTGRRGPLGHPVMYGATSQAVYGPPVEHQPRRRRAVMTFHPPEFEKGSPEYEAYAAKLRAVLSDWVVSDA